MRCLGAGGMGVVYEALDRERNVRVALKTLRAMSADTLLLFKSEFREFQNLQHPNLVSVGELFADEGEWFFTMELIDGQSFLEYVRPGTFAARGRSFDALPAPGVEIALEPTRPHTLRPPSNPTFHEARLRPALKQLVQGLCALHDAQKVHRDIKPSNILVTDHGRVVLLDFGLATDLGRREHKSEVDIVGTVEYMAPEQAAGRQVGPEADWYAVGVVLYEALTGQVPLAGPAIEVLMNKQRLNALPPRTMNPNVPEDLDALCTELLRFNPSQRPTGKQLLARLGATEERASTTSLSSFGSSAHFIGRERELSVLRDGFERSRTGAHLVAVHGESGVGKSALVRRFTEQLVARESGVVVLAGTCYERESVPYKAVDGLIDELSRYMRRLHKAEAAALLPRRAGLLAEVFPVLARVEAVAEAPRAQSESLDPPEMRSRLFGALRELLFRLTDRHPLVLVIDDLQWADADSLALLQEIVRPDEAPRLLLLATIRTSEADPVPAVNESILETAQLLPLARMPPAEARELAQALVRRAQGPAALKAHQIAQEAEGHPLFMDELIRHACAVGVRPEGPLQLEEALWARIVQLDQQARYVLELVCLASGRLIQQTAAQAAGMGFGDFGKQVSLLRVAHLLRTTGMRGTDSVEPYHGRVRAAVLAHLSPEVSSAHHRRLALALETSGQPDPEALTTHYSEAGDLEKAAHFAAVAADKAMRALAFDRAVRFYQWCLELMKPPPRELRVRLGDALANAGRGGEAGAAYLAATDGAVPGEALDLRRRAAEQLLRSGHIDEGLRAIQSVLAAVGMKLPSTPTRALMSLLFRRVLIRGRGLGYTERDVSQLSAKELSLIDICWSVSAGLGVVDTIRGADFQTRQTLLALRAGEPYRVVRALAMEAGYVALGGEATRVRTTKLLDATSLLARRIAHPHALGLTTWAAGLAAFLQGRWQEGHRLTAEAEETFRERCTGVSWELDTARFFSLWSSFYRGDVVDLFGRVPLLLRESEVRGDLYAVTNLRTAFTPFLRLVTDDPVGSHVEAEDAIARWSRQGFHLQHFNALFSGVQADLYAGQPADAHRRLVEAWPTIERSMLLQVQQIRIRAQHFRASCLLAVGSIEAALRDAKRLESEKVGWSLALALTLRAGASRDAALFAQAAAALDAADMSLYAAAARRRQGELLASDEGRALCEEADAWMLRQQIRHPDRMTDLLAPLGARA